MYHKYIIPNTLSVRDALSVLNANYSGAATLLVVNDNGEMVGSITDGDIRRGLIAGCQTSDGVDIIMQRNFRCVRKNKINVHELRDLRNSGIKVVPVLDTHDHIIDVINFIDKTSILPIDVVIMAGGKGERLRPLTEKTPKPLLQVGDKSIIDYNIDRSIQYGVEHISVTTNYLAEQIESHFIQPHNGVNIQCVREPKFLGTMGAVRLIKEFHNNVVLVMNSDLFTDIDFEDMYLHFMEYGADMSIAAVPYTVSIPFGICDLDGRYVKGIVEKPTYNYYANAGIYMLRREVIDRIPQGEFYNATDLIDALVKNGSVVIRYPLKGTWIDIGTMSEYQKAKDLIKHMK